MRVKIASYFKIQLLLQHLNSTAINTDIFIEDLHGVPVIRTFILENMGHPHILCFLWVDISTGIELGQQMIRETSLFAL